MRAQLVVLLIALALVASLYPFYAMLPAAFWLPLALMVSAATLLAGKHKAKKLAVLAAVAALVGVVTEATGSGAGLWRFAGDGVPAFVLFSWPLIMLFVFLASELIWQRLR
jgi:hypothetical protein